MRDLSPYLIQHTESTPILLTRVAANTNETVSDGIGINEIWRVIRRWLWLTGPMVGGALAITVVVLFLVPPNYTAKATLLIEPEAPQVLNMTQLIEDAAGNQDYDYYKTQFDLLKSRVIAARVIRELDLAHNPEFNRSPSTGPITRLWNDAWELLAGALSKNGPAPTSLEDSVDPNLIDAYVGGLRVEPVLATRLVMVSFSLPDPVLAARIANTHVQQYVKRELEIRTSAQKEAEDFLRAQLAEIGQQIEQSEEELNAYRRRQGVLSFDVKDTNQVAAQRMAELTKALTQAETQRITAQSQLELVNKGEYESLPQVVNNATVSALKPQLIALRTEYARLSAAFNPGYPKLIELKAQLQQAEQAIATQIRYTADSIRRDYNAALSQEKQLRDEIQAEKQHDLALNDALLKDSVLSREVETNRDLYKNVLQRMNEMAVASQTPLSNISVVEEAVPPLFASTPKKKIDLAIVALGMTLIGIALSFILEQSDQSLRTPEEIAEFLKLPSLAVVPDFARLAQAPSLQRMLRLTCLRARRENPRLSRLERASLGASEVYRTIRTNIMFSRAHTAPRTLLFTSSIEGEGKTFTALHTAAAFARTGASTLLVNADLRRPRCDSLLNCEGIPGLTDALVKGRDDVIYHLRGRPFDFLPAGTRVRNPAELLSSLRMSEFIDSLKKRYTFVLFDSAPLMQASETLALAAMIDGVVMVVGAATPKQNVRAACDRLAVFEAKLHGVVLNGVDINQPDYRDYARYYYRDDYRDDQDNDLSPVEL